MDKDAKDGWWDPRLEKAPRSPREAQERGKTLEQRLAKLGLPEGDNRLATRLVLGWLRDLGLREAVTKLEGELWPPIEKGG